MESELLVANNYLPFDVFGGAKEICTDKKDVGFVVKSFDINYDSFIDITSNYEFQVDIEFNPQR